MSGIRLGIVAVCLTCGVAMGQTTLPGDDGDWVENMRQAHGKFNGAKNTLAQFGDSITFSQAYFSGLQWKRDHASKEMDAAWQRVSKYMVKDCWSWKGGEFGSASGMTILWAQKNVDAWLAKLRPETATIMFGTNDLSQVPLKDYEPALREVIGKCLKNGTVVILSTIPPRHGQEAKCEEFVAVQRKVAKEMKIPLMDFYAEVLKRRPDDWDGASDKFKDYKGYDVPTLISRDGVHPSLPTRFDGDYSAEGLTNNGYALRSWLTLMKYDLVIEKVMQ